MRPELFDIPFIGWPVKAYGAMLTIGFLSGVWLSMKRAERMKADPDMVLNIGFVCLICSIVGSRLFFVIHYWESSFKTQPNPLLAALDFTNGGLEYYGGLIGALLGSAVYVAIKRVSLRMYFDIMIPGAAWGLAFGRMGCLLNGCCWGGVAVDSHGHQSIAWSIQFPHGSPAQVRQWENRQLTLPAELVYTGALDAYPVPRQEFEQPIEKREGPELAVRNLKDALDNLQATDPDSPRLDTLKKELQEAHKKLEQHLRHHRELHYATNFPARSDPTRAMTVSEVRDLMNQYASLPVHPTQVYGIINALVISWVLLEILYRRKRHGVVLAALCIIYPVTRILLEMIRVDNPQDSAGLTISQAVSVAMFLFGIGLLFYLRRLPLRSPLAVPFVPPQPEEKAAQK